MYSKFSTATMCSLVLIMPLLFTVLASPALRSRAVQDVDTYGNPVDAQGNPVDLEGNMFDNNPSLASANLEGAGWTDSLGTTLDRQGYPLSTDPSPTNLGNNIYLGAPGQQDGLIAAVDRIKEGFVPTASNPCPNLHTLCSKVMQYFPLAYIIKADPCSFPSTYQLIAFVQMSIADLCDCCRGCRGRS